MDERDIQLKIDIMRRVRTVHGLRLFLSPQMIKALVFLASSVSFLFMVSIVHCIENISRMPSAAAYAQYLLSAFVKTSFSVQSAVILALAAGAWLMRDIIHTWSSRRSFARL